ncbi:hypothetical protein PENTCL1PPCAC_12049 [Pristionchus entomophagus]|uniref:Uncharacterized protein n=1 Tax=Pristionchus entomophagus TaxID=358040 RepID=A0AAV5TB23_9BILA|nr:hypothetical protein PENTCL1PPCAC_12049 [Pristionchus entomophagus]
MSTDNGRTRSISAEERGLITQDFYEFSRLGKLTLPCIHQLYTSSNWVQYPEELRYFFSQTLVYYSARKRLEGGVDFMQTIAPFQPPIEISTPVQPAIIPQDSLNQDNVAASDKHSSSFSSIKPDPVSPAESIIVIDDDSSPESSRASGAGSPTAGHIDALEEREVPSTSTSLEGEEQREETIPRLLLGGQSPDYPQDYDDVPIDDSVDHQQAPGTSANESSQSSHDRHETVALEPLFEYGGGSPSYGYEDYEDNGEDNDTPVTAANAVAGDTAEVKFEYGGGSPNYSPTYHEEAEQVAATLDTAAARAKSTTSTTATTGAREATFKFEKGGGSPNYSPSYHEETDVATTTITTAASGEDVNERPRSAASSVGALIIDEGSCASTPLLTTPADDSDKPEYDPWSPRAKVDAGRHVIQLKIDTRPATLPNGPSASPSKEGQRRKDGSANRSSEGSPPLDPHPSFPSGRPAPPTKNVTLETMEKARQWRERQWKERAQRPTLSQLDPDLSRSHLPPIIATSRSMIPGHHPSSSKPDPALSRHLSFLDNLVNTQPSHVPAVQPTAPLLVPPPAVASSDPSSTPAAVSSRTRSANRDPRLSRDGPSCRKSADHNQDRHSSMEIDDGELSSSTRASATSTSDIDAMLAWAGTKNVGAPPQHSRKRRASPSLAHPDPPPQSPSEKEQMRAATSVPQSSVRPAVPSDFEKQTMLNNAKKILLERSRLASQPTTASDHPRPVAATVSTATVPALSKEQTQTMQEKLDKMKLLKEKEEKKLLKARANTNVDHASPAKETSSTSTPPSLSEEESKKQQEVWEIAKNNLQKVMEARENNKKSVPPVTRSDPPLSSPQIQPIPLQSVQQMSQFKFNAPKAYNNPSQQLARYQMRYRPSNWPPHVQPIPNPPKENQVTCAFCDSKSHYSEYCDVYSSTFTRFERQRERRLCLTCLEKYAGNAECRKTSHRRECPYCGTHNNNLAFCRKLCKE